MTDSRHGSTADPKFELLRGLDLPVADYVIFGSAAMWARGLRQRIDDIDIVARRLAWKVVASLGTPTTTPSGYGRMVELYDGRLQFFDRWISPGWNVDELIGEAEMIDGLPFAPLKQVYRSKLETNRPKDADDLRALREYYSSR